MNYQIETKKGYVEMIDKIEPNLAITLMTFPGCQISYDKMFSNLVKMDKDVSKKVIGRNWYKKPDQDRMNGVYVLEHGISGMNPHWHGLIRVPQKDLLSYQFRIKNTWKDLAGDSWISSHPEDLEKYTKETSYYLLKEINLNNTDNIVFTNFLR